MVVTYANMGNITQVQDSDISKIYKVYDVHSSTDQYGFTFFQIVFQKLRILFSFSIQDMIILNRNIIISKMPQLTISKKYGLGFFFYYLPHVAIF